MKWTFRTWWAPLALVMTVFVCGGPAATAQTPPPAQPVDGEVSVDALDCWWRTEKTAVQVGERFTLTLTCAVVETERHKAVVDPSQLDPSALSLAPFEIVSGVRHEDVVAPPRRIFQYEYSVRVIGEGFFGQDIDIPGMTLKYIIASSLGEGEGREQTYLMPALSMRVLTLVPTRAADIRDASRESFGEMEARRRRASEQLVAAAVAFGFAVVLFGLAVATAFRRYRRRAPVAARPLPAATLLGASLAAIRTMEAEIASGGWTADRAVRVLSAVRVAAAVALGRPVAQSPAAKSSLVHEGQVLLCTGILRRRRVLISAATGSETIARQLEAAGASAPHRSIADALEDLRQALQMLSTTRYGRSGQLDATALDGALETAARAIRRLRAMSVWRIRKVGALSKAAAVVGAWVWLR